MKEKNVLSFDYKWTQCEEHMIFTIYKTCSMLIDEE